MRRGKDPAFKEQAQKLYLEGLGLRAIGQILGVHHKIVSRWLVQAAGQLPVDQPKTRACSLIEIDELCSFVAKKNINAGSGQQSIPLLAKCLALSVIVDQSKPLENFSRN